MTTKPPVFNFDAMSYHPATEGLVQYLATRANSKDLHFIRVIIAFYLGLVTSTMRNSVVLPGNRPVPLNIFAMGLLPTGQGKGVLTGEMEDVILKPLSGSFTKTWMAKREALILKEATSKANQNGTRPEDEEKEVRKSIESLGAPILFFEEGTSPAFKQCRSALIRVPYGSLNFIVDEYFQVDGSNAEVMQDMIKTYDVGQLKQKLIKHSSDNPRHIDSGGNVPTNMLLFGSGTELDKPNIHADLTRNLENGLARRSFFAFSRDTEKTIIPAAQRLANFKLTSDPKTVKAYTDAITKMIAPTMYKKAIYMDEATSLYMLEYQNHCEQRALDVKDKILRAELTHRYMKVSKAAGIYAAYDGVDEVTIEHLQAAMKMAEEGDEHIARIVHTVPLHARLAEYLSEQDGELTMAQLVGKLPWFKGTVAAREEMLQLASEYGYSNSIIINQETRNGITFLSGEGITPTDLTKVRLAMSNHDAYNYQNGVCDWPKLGKALTQQGKHWITHWVKDGRRHGDYIQAGFNLIALDVDNSTSNVPMHTAKELLKDYTYLMYESKSSTPEVNRYRIVMPISHELKLSEEVFSKFMTNIFDWLPIPLDEVTNQRSRKWLGYNSTPHYNDGALLPALDFIPETEASVRLQKQTVQMGDLSHVERWFVRKVNKGAPRNNTLIQYALMLVDADLSQENVESSVLALNAKLPTPLPESEIKTTILVTASKAIAKKLGE